MFLIEERLWRKKMDAYLKQREILMIKSLYEIKFPVDKCKEFVEALDENPKEIPAIKKLFSKKTLID